MSSFIKKLQHSPFDCVAVFFMLNIALDIDKKRRLKFELSLLGILKLIKYR